VRWPVEVALKEYQGYLHQVPRKLAKEIRKIFSGTIDSLIVSLEDKDRYTAGHSRRVTEIAMVIGRKMGLSSDELDDLQCAALLHDVGKIAVDPAVEKKPGKLNAEEYRHIMIHTQVGPRIVKPIANDNIIQIIRHHHDRYDGKGAYQNSQDGYTPIGARILAVADALDAMTSERPYRKALALEQAIAEIKRGAGKQFDPVVVDVLLKYLMDKTANTASLSPSL